MGDGLVTGVWHNRTAEYWARKRAEEIAPGQFISEEALSLRPLPCWDELSSEEVRARIVEIVTAITAETRQRLRQAEKLPLGVRRILRQNPHSRPRRIARSAAPRFHAATWQIRRMLEAMYLSYRDAYRDAVQNLRENRLHVRFPSHGIPPPGLCLADLT